MKKSTNLSSKNDKDYSGSYSESAFWGKLKKYWQQIGKEGVENALLLFYALRLGKLSAGQIVVVIAALGYLIAPYDLVPDMLFGGFLDDIAVIAAALKKIMAVVERYPEIRRSAQRTLSSWFGRRQISA